MAAALRSLHLWIMFCVFLIFFVSAQAESQFIFHGFHEANLHLDGTAEIHPSGLLQLTNTSKQQVGHAIYKVPLKFNASSSNPNQSLSFSTNFVFAMVPELPNFGGHGIAFFISPSINFSYAVPTQYLGLFNASNNGLSTNHILAIELDTVISPEFEDNDKNHVGIDVNGLKSNLSAPAMYFSSKEGKNKSIELLSGDPIQVWIDYDQVEKLLNVTLATLRTAKPNRPLLSRSINLSEIFLETMYVGFSAATGTVASDQYILGWSFNKSGKAQNLELQKLPGVLGHRKAPKKPSPVVIVLLVAALLLLLTIAAVVFLFRRKRYQEVCEEWEKVYSPQRFSYKDLYRATKGFKDKGLLGAGGFGKVYRGILPSRVQIAVKRVSHKSEQGMKEFVAEIISMGRLRHRNLVRLLGYCRRRGELLLVYDYMPNGSLDQYLFSNEKPNLVWSQRFHILRGVASALLYLHEEWEQVVLHRDIKASNVMLDANLNGRLRDFGLARLYDHGTNPLTTQLVGTIGYMAPELPRTGKASTSTDVFAFGAFMLEIACGRRPIELQRQSGEINLVDWVVQCWKRGELLNASDPRLDGNYDKEEIELVLKLGLLCSHVTPAARPSMRQVMHYLDGSAQIPDIITDSAGIGISVASNEVSELFLSFTTSFATINTDSNLNRGSGIHSV